jgi:hypothetical protein
MAMRLSGTNCWITTKCAKDSDEYATHVFCMSRLRGLKCPREGSAGTKPYELSLECFKAVQVPKKKTRKP